MKKLFAALLLLAALQAPPVLAQSGVGIVLLHGKQGTPAKVIDGLANALRGAGYAVETPQMCWSGRRIYDRPFLECVGEIDAAIAKLTVRGARKIVVAGQSQGGDAALVYAARHPTIAGVIALAPASAPEQLNNRPEIAQSVAQAKAMVAAGRANESASFADTNNGANFSTKTSATIYLSFFDPLGPANMVEAVRRVRAPLLWVAGSADRTQAGANATFAQAPPNPLSRFVSVSADHLGTPSAAKDAVLGWLPTLR